jgi:hypothetical protein
MNSDWLDFRFLAVSQPHECLQYPTTVSNICRHFTLSKILVIQSESLKIEKAVCRSTLYSYKEVTMSETDKLSPPASNDDDEVQNNKPPTPPSEEKGDDVVSEDL